MCIENVGTDYMEHMSYMCLCAQGAMKNRTEILPWKLGGREIFLDDNRWIV